ncbi:MAG TPA: GAF domain-containing protein [Candidatus Binatia bacterium]|nr:GAF domain-containing protein [Candidatus Binatia bacterium]
MLNESLAEITRTLEVLRVRLQEMSHGQATSASPAPAGAGGGDPLPTAVRAFEDILALAGAAGRTEDVFARALDRLGQSLNADRAMVFVWDPERARLLPRAARGFRRDDPADIALAAGEGLVGRAFAGRRPLGYSGADGHPPDDPFIARFPVRDALAAPIHIAADPVGVLYVGRRGAADSPPMDQSLAVLLIADQLGAALAHERLAARMGEHMNRLVQLGAFSGEAVVGRDLDRILAVACDTARGLAGASAAVIWMRRPGDGLVAGASSGIPDRAGVDDAADQPHEIAAQVFATQRPVVQCQDLEAEGAPAEPYLRALGMRSCAAVPLRAGGPIVGALYLAGAEPRDFSVDALEAVQVLVSVAGLAIENDRLYRQVQRALDELSAAQERLVQTEKMRALGEMAGGIAHEFNNILAIILGKTQLLLARSPEDPLREGLGVIEEAAWRAADVVRRLQGFGTGPADDIRSPVDVGALVRDAVTLTRSIWKDEAEARGVRIDLVTDISTTPPVPGNAATLREAVTNLLMNAIDAMPGGGRLGLTTRAENGGVVIAVEDSGEGIAEEVRGRIFDPFFTTRHPLRSGLGLSVVHGIVTRHRGRISVSSVPGRGTQVSLWLPVAPPAPPPVEAGTPSGLSILVLEDEAAIRKTLVETLIREGHMVESVADGLSGLARFQGGDYDLVLTDLSLPECSGLDVARAVKRMRPETPVILVTGWGHLLDPTRLCESGVDLMLVKPFRIEQLLAVVEDARRLRPAM